jgi:2-phospho-L-lactate/phosphoenolpyruvate guanylyltransferase
MNADLSNVVALIPVRSLSGSKSRLGEPLDAEERASLVLGLLRRSVRAVFASQRVSGAVVVSMDGEILAEAAALGARPLLQKTAGLNEGLAEGREAVAAAATAVLVLPADLPEVGPASIDRLIDTADAGLGSRAGDAGEGVGGAGVVALVPDRHGTGTNALLVSPPNLIEFCFGEGSRRDHSEAARRAGALYLEVDGPLNFDVDTPEDLLLADLRGLDHEAGR